MINLLPDDIKQDINYGKLNVTIVQFAIVIILVSLSLVGLLFFGVSIVSQDETTLRQITDQEKISLAQYDESLKKAEDLEKTIITVGKLLDREVSFYGLLQDIGGVIPSEASLTGISLTGNPSEPLRIDAITNSQETAAILRQNLEESDLFSKADIQTIIVGDVDSQNKPINYQVRIVVQFAQGDKQ